MVGRRRRRLGCVTRLFLLLVIVAVGIGLAYGFDMLVTAPWAYGIFGRSTLTGSWTGTVQARSGARYAFYLQLEHSRYFTDLPTTEGTGRGGLGKLFGSLTWCARDGPTRNLTVEGTANHSASDVTIGVHVPDHPRPGLYPSSFHGAWHGSTLALLVSFVWRQGISAISSSARWPDLSLTMRKRGYRAYQDACAQR